jgi:hypothetical protein
MREAEGRFQPSAADGKRNSIPHLGQRCGRHAEKTNMIEGDFLSGAVERRRPAIA